MSTKKKDRHIGFYIGWSITSLFLAFLIVMGSIDTIRRLDKVIFPNELPIERTDVFVEFKHSDLDLLETKYIFSENEYLFCLIGVKDDNVYKIDSLEEVRVAITDKSSFTTFAEDICKGNKYIGTLHSHPSTSVYERFRFNSRKNLPSRQDLFFYGVVGKPLNMIQFNKDKFYANEYITEITSTTIRVSAS